jgi:hypothetical protein
MRSLLSLLVPCIGLSLFTDQWACASRAVLGNAEIRAINDSRVRGTFEVEKGYLRGGAFAAAIAMDGCVHGAYQLDEVLLLCPTMSTSSRQEWSGVGGDMYVELSEDGALLHMTGYLSRLAIDPPLRRPRSVDGIVASQPLITPVGERVTLDVSVPLGEGPQWDELRRHPVLLAIAAAVAGVRR